MHSCMATIKCFEELEIWQLARLQANDFNKLAETTSLSKDYELRNQMNASSGSVMDCIAEGFERSGNNEFKNMLVIAKGSNGEFRSQLYRCLNRRHITQEKFSELYSKNEILGRKIMVFIQYLQKSEYKGQRYKKEEASTQPQTSNIKHQTDSKGQRYKKEESSIEPQTSNLKPQTEPKGQHYKNDEASTQPQTSNLKPQTK